MRAVWYFSIGVFWAVAAYGQAVVEHSLATAGSSAATAGVSGAGKSIGGVFRSLNETLDKAGAPGTAKESGNAPAPRSASTFSGPSKQSGKLVSTSKPIFKNQPVTISKPIDPSQVTVGLDRAEVIQRFGEPVLSFSETRNSQLVERLWYNTTTASDQVEIRFIGDKVASVRPPPGSLK